MIRPAYLEDYFKITCKNCGSHDVELYVDECQRCGNNVNGQCHTCDAHFDYHEFKEINTKEKL